MTYKKVLVLLLGIILMILVTSCVRSEKDVVGKSFDTLTSYQKQKYWQCMEKDCNGLLLSKQYPAYRQCALNCMNSAENTLEQQAWCKDSDGIDYFSKGIVTTDVYPQGKEDYCKTFSNGKTYLIEGKCFNNKYSYMQKSCNEAKKGYLCVEVKGACVPECVTPPENLDEPWQVSENTKLCEGTYSMPKGIEIMKDGVELDCGGAVLSGGLQEDDKEEELSMEFGIHVQNKEGIKIQNCIIESYKHGIYLESSNNGEIIHNTLKNNNDHGVLLYNSHYNLLKENKVENSGKVEPVIIYAGIYLGGSNYNTIEQNELFNNDDNGITISKSNENYIYLNHLNDNKYYGIQINDNSKSNEITDNILINNYNSGFSIGADTEDLLVKDNLIKGSITGINLWEQGKDITIEHNTIAENEEGIVVSTLSENLEIKYNNIYDNYYYDLSNNQPESLIVENNYWGAIDTYEIVSKIIKNEGFVDFCPYLDAPYPDGEPVECGEFYKYKQKILFENQNTGTLGFYQDDDYAPIADVYFFVSNKLNTYFYNYTIIFDEPVPYDASSLEAATTSLVGKTFTNVQGKNAKITFVDLDESHKINRIDIKVDGNIITFGNGYEIGMDEDEFPNINAKAYIKGTTGTLDGFGYKVKAAISPIYLAKGDEFVDPVIGGFKFIFAELAEDDKEKIEIKTSGKKGTITFLNKDSKEISIFMYSSADANNIIYLGTTTTSTEVDNMIYLENTSCKATTSVSECKGAEFIVSAGSNCEAHLIKVSDINTVDTKISFEDETYGTETNDYDYTSGTAFNPGLSGISDTISLTAGTDYINFTNLGTCYYPAANPKYLKIKTKNEGFVYMNYSLGGAAGGQGTSFTQPRIANISFAEYHDTGHAIANTVFLSETNNQLLQIDPIYDTSSDNVLKLVFDKSGNVFDTSDLKYTFGLMQSGTNSEVKQTMSYKGTLFTINDVQKNSIEILHPKVTSYIRLFATSNKIYNDDTSSPIMISEGYEIGNKDFYLGMSLYMIDDLLTSSDLPETLSDGVLT